MFKPISGIILSAYFMYCLSFPIPFFLLYFPSSILVIPTFLTLVTVLIVLTVILIITLGNVTQHSLSYSDSDTSHIGLDTYGGVYCISPFPCLYV